MNEPPRPPAAPVIAVGVAAVALVGLWSWGARYGDMIPTYQHPPLYGRFEPVWGAWAVVGIGAGLALAVVVAALAPSKAPPRPRRVATFLVALVAAGSAAALGIGAARGGPVGWTTMLDRTAPRSGSDFRADAPTVERLGVRRFVERFPDLVVAERIYSVHSRTHPPGAVVLSHTIHGLAGRDTRRMAVALTVLGLLGAVPAYILARAVGTRGEGRTAALLFAVTPSVLLFSTSSLDAPIAAAVASAGALLVVAAVRRSPPLAVAGGAALGAASFLTYATGLVGIAAAAATVVVVRRPWEVLRLGVAMAGGLALSLGGLWLAFGFSLLDCFMVDLDPNLAVFEGSYWERAQFGAYAIGLGPPLLVFGVAGMLGRARRHVPAAALLGCLAALWLSPLRREHLAPGELERTWLFTVPYVAAAAAPAVAAWTRARGRRVMFGLAATSLATTCAIALAYDTYW